MVTDEYVQWGLLDTSAFLFYRCPNSPYPNPSTALRVCVCVPQNGFLRSSFEMKEHEENGNGKKMGNKLRHVLWNDEIFSSSSGLLRFHFGFSLNFSKSFKS